MSTSTASFARRPQGPLTRIVPDRRRHKRVAVTLLGRFMRTDRQEYPCKVRDISIGGVAVLTPSTVEPDERIVAYIDHVGGLEGTVARTFDGGFALKFAITPHKREKLAAQLTWLLNRSVIGGAEERRHERVAPHNRSSTLTLAEGIVVPCSVLDVSISGASIGTPARPQIGTEVVLGKLRGRVMRHHETGIGVQFIDVQNPTALRRYFG